MFQPRRLDAKFEPSRLGPSVIPELKNPGQEVIRIDSRIRNILDRAQEGIPPSRRDCVDMLGHPAQSLEASVIRAAADAIARQRFGNQAIIMGQLGIETDACPGRCVFCGFAEGQTRFRPGEMSLAEILVHARNLSSSGDLYALFVMTMHRFDFERLIGIVRALREQMPMRQIIVNTGDFSLEQADILRNAGANGAYHICRLREGIDTGLDPAARKRTIKAVKDAGLDLYYCCEPIGPEHSPEELVEQFFVGIDVGCVQHAAMRRVNIPGTQVASRGQITELRLAQITAVIALASLACPGTRSIAVHEPSLIALTSGANAVWAEAGANPRDTLKDTSENRGRDMEACQSMLWEACFNSYGLVSNL